MFGVRGYVSKVRKGTRPAHLPSYGRHEVSIGLFGVYARALILTLTLVLTTGLITIFILVISVIGKCSVICDC